MPERLDLTYDLFALPSSQHRAGLAGLLLVHRALTRLRATNVPDLDYGDGGVVSLGLTQASLTTLLNEVYDATTEESRRNNPLKDRRGEAVRPLRTETVEEIDGRTGQARSKTVYVYPQVVPRIRCLQMLGMPESWLTLWRETIWNTLRAVPKTRLPFEQRARGENAAEATATWRDLVRWRREADRGRHWTSDVAGSVFLGAQSENAERVPFRGRADETLLLHFWPVVMGVAEARALKLAEGQVRDERTGYVIVVPDVVDLPGFVDDFEDATAQLGTEMVGYRPRDAIVSLPQESALEYLHQLGAVSTGRARQGALAFSVAGFDVYHLDRRGNSVVGLGTARIPASRGLLHQYDLIRRDYGNLLFRRQLIANLLAGRTWYSGFDRLFNTNQRELFFAGGRQGFTSNARRRFWAAVGSHPEH